MDFHSPFGPEENEVLIEELGEEEEMEVPKIKIGVCAMNKKTKAQPMQEILSRIAVFDFFEFVIFTDDIITNEPIEKWPLCDCLISFYSSGFPLDKAIEYAKLRKPFVLNDLEIQQKLMDRREVYKMLQSEGLDTPRYAILLRDEDGNPINTTFTENEDSVQIGNVTFQKPFVEKPVNAEDHKVFIYYPMSAGGGSQRLFRKVGSRSSEYSTESSVRKKGSFLYEDFVPTDGIDIKVYTVGPEYAHAEARKSPSLDGKVERDSQGKEIRYPVILNSYEKELANKVCKKFKQTVCGFDILRTPGMSYVCDVNGFSFVKTSKKYYEDAAQVLASTILQQLAPQLYTPYNLVATEDLTPATTLDGTMLELRCVVGVIRHGDRTPKQKMKMQVWHPRFIELFKKYGGFDEKKLKLKRPKQLQEVLDIARDLLKEVKDGSTLQENPNKLHQMKSVLEMYGHFSGINRKIQFKYLGKQAAGEPTDHEHSSSEDRNRKDSSDTGNPAPKESKVKREADRKEQTADASEENCRETLLLILKWGGELTAMGREQAEGLGKAFRCMYPGGQGEYASFPGGGLLRLHSTYRHDLKIYASDEGRVQMTAAAFAKGFLALEGELTPILVHLVRSDKSTTEMLDTSDDANKIMAKVKRRLHDILHSDQDFTEEDIAKLATTKATSLVKAMKTVHNPRTMCSKLYSYVQSLTSQLKDLVNQKKHECVELYHDESLELMLRRWSKLKKDFKLKSGKFDISLIPDIYDCIKYDVQHNSQLDLDNTYELYQCAKALADIVMPQEYGITVEEKLAISQRVCLRLMKKIYGDLKSADQGDVQARLNPRYSQSVVSPHRHVRTRLYFTSESHVHTFVNALRYGKLFEENTNEQWKKALDYLAELPELNYMTQIVLMLYEDPKADPQSDKRFHVEFHFSPGAMTVSEQRAASANACADQPGVDLASPCEAECGDHPRGASNVESGGCVPGAQALKPRSFEESNYVESERIAAASTETKEWRSVHTPTDQSSGRSSGSSRNLSSPTEKKISDFDESDDVTYEYSRNECPRYSIGCGDYSDSQPTSRSNSANTSSGLSVEESPSERPYSKSDTQLLSAVVSQDVRTIDLDDEIRRLSDSDVRLGERSEEPTPRSQPIAVPTNGENETKKDQSRSGSLPDDREALPTEDSSALESEEPRVRRRKSHSVSELDRPPLEILDEPQDPKDAQGDDEKVQAPDCFTEHSPTTGDKAKCGQSRDFRTRKLSDSFHPAIRVVQSSPALKKFSPGRLSWHTLARTSQGMRAVRKLSWTMQSALVVRPYSSSVNPGKKAQVPERCLNMPSIQSLNPLRTLHDSLGLPQVEEYLNRMTQGSDGTVYTPEGTPTRKPPVKRLHLKPGTHKRVGKLTEPTVRRSWDLSDLAGKTTTKEGVTATESSPTVTTIITTPATTANTTTSVHQCTLAATTPDTTATSDDGSDSNSADSHMHNNGHTSGDN